MKKRCWRNRNGGRRLETPGYSGRKRPILGHEEWNSQESLGGSEEKVRLGHRRARRVPAGEGVYLEGKIARKRDIVSEPGNHSQWTLIGNLSGSFCFRAVSLLGTGTS